MAHQRDISNKKGIGCLGFFRRRSNSTSRKEGESRNNGQVSSPTRSVSMQTLERSKSSDSLMSVTSADVTFSNTTGMLDSFAKMITAEKLRRRQSGNLRIEKMIMTPYFGHFAGQKLTFDLKKNADFLVSIKVRVEDQVLASLLHRQGKKKETVRDQCIKFAHEVTSQFTIHQPPSLSFCCEQTIILLLNDLPYWHLPPRYRHQFDGHYHTITIQVHPQYIHNNPITLKLKRNISIREVQWMLSKRLKLNNPSAITLYSQDSLETLSALSPLPENLSELICIIAPSSQQLRASVDPGPLSICVSVIGKGVKEVSVYHTTTLFEFEKTVKAKFKLAPDSFLYLPDVLFQHNGSYSSHCPLRMHAVIDQTSSTVLLLDHHNRSFPILHGHLAVIQQQTLQSLLLYRMTLSELDLLKSGPVIGFEVTGPTIPIAFKTMNDLNSDPNRCVISIRPHAVSINPKWSIPVLLKYLTRISGFPCNSIKIGERVLKENVATDILYQNWFTIQGKDYILPHEIPCAQAC